MSDDTIVGLAVLAILFLFFGPIAYAARPSDEPWEDS